LNDGRRQLLRGGGGGEHFPVAGDKRLAHGAGLLRRVANLPIAAGA
jgi:hypothetical protein